MKAATLILVAVITAFALAQNPTNECYNGIGEPTRCEPLRQSFSLGQVPIVNSTCGSPPNEFCFRRVSLGTILSDCTGVCDSDDPENAHPPSHMTDFLLNEQSRWQSENNVNIVVIELSLQTMVEISVIAFNFFSLKPDGFYIEKSIDYGETYEIVHYLATSCLDRYMIDPELTLDIQNETSLLCQSIGIPPVPGQISFFPTLGRPSANDSISGYSEELYNFITATNIRVVLDGHYIIDQPPEDPGFYYAITDLNVIGTCQCHGHASSCVIVTGDYQCQCQHNTTGTFCERCADFYNDIPWQRSDGRGPFECRACECNTHSNVCIFDPDVYAQSGGISGGVCINCSDNTAGRHCETCADLFYPRPDRNQTDSDFCAACECDLRGVTNTGDCAKVAGLGVQPGDCFCKSNTIGRTCGECELGFFNLSISNPDGCQACECNLTGSLNTTCDQFTGNCFCKPNIIGNKCDLCEPGSYQADPNSLQSCVRCNCNLGGAFTNQCDMFTGQCNCRQGVGGRTCSEPISGNFYPAIDHIRFEGETADGIPSYEILTSGENNLFTGTGYYRVMDQISIINFGTVVLPVSGQYEVLFRYTLEDVLLWDTATLTIQIGSEEGDGPADCSSELPEGEFQIQYSPWMMGIGVTISQNFCLRGGRSYTFILGDFDSGQPAGEAILLIDSLVVILIEASTLQVFADPDLAREYIECVNLWRRIVTQSSTCDIVTFTVSTELYNGTLRCDCDVTGTIDGTVCNPFGGQCVCQPGIRGRQCNECSPGTFNLTSTGCTSCSCDDIGSDGPICQPTDGNCFCLPNVVGRNCSSCAANHWNLTTDIGCEECDCNATGSQSLQCDEVTGQCICNPGVVGQLCDECAELHFGFSDDGCSPCSCSEGGTEATCDLITGQCTCRNNTEGRDCSQCIQGTFSLQESNPLGCQSCFCSGQSTICSAAAGFVASTILTEFNTSDTDPLQGWTVVHDIDLVPIPTGSVIATTLFPDRGTILTNATAYLAAPPTYLGNKLSSYNQFLEITLEVPRNDTQFQTLLLYDVVLVRENSSIGIQFPTITDNGINTLRLQLHESSGWRNVATNQPISTFDLQFILSSLEQLLVTTSYNIETILYNISLDTAVPESGLTGTTSVDWVEQCECQTNYTGLSCEECTTGFTRTSSGSCEVCQCNGRSVTCNPETGECTNCSENTAGTSCNQCANGTYGDPMNDIECQPCPCPLTFGIGQFTPDCMLLNDSDSNSLICLNCPLGHTGAQCQTCADGFFGDPLGQFGVNPTGCSDCLCNGNADPSIPGSCNSTNGVCLICLNNSTGDQCQRCADGFFGDAIVAKNCTECNCSSIGSSGSNCNQTTGECDCLPNVEGQRCDRCAPDHYNLSSGSGCVPCNCSSEGADSSQCDSGTGICSCRSGVTGQLCDQCLPRFFGFSSAGCQECSCSVENSESNTCDNSGECTCAPGATGPECERCIENYFQTNSGCVVCPDCYQQLQMYTNVTRNTLNVTETNLRVFELSNMSSPFEERLLQNQSAVERTLTDAQQLQYQHMRLVDQFSILSSSIADMLTIQLIQINNSLTILQGASTPVFVLALTAEELMNRTIQEILAASGVMNTISTVILPSAHDSVAIVNNSFLIANSTALSLEAQISLLSSQVVQLANLSDAIATISILFLTDTQSLQELHDDTSSTITDLQSNITFAQTSVSTLMPQLAQLATSISTLVTCISQQLQSLVSIPPIYEVNGTLSNVTTTASYANTLMAESIIQSNRLAGLTESIDSNRQVITPLLQQISIINGSVSALMLQTENADALSSLAANLTETAINNARLVLTNLRNFSEDTFAVSNAANDALLSIGMIYATATIALNKSRDIENNVELLRQNVSLTKTLAEQITNQTQQAELDITATEASTTEALSALSTNLSSTVRHLQSIQSNATEISSIHSALINQNAMIDAVEQLVATSINLTSQSEVLQNQTTISLSELQDDLADIDELDPTRLEAIQMFIQNVTGEVTAADVAAVYQTLKIALQNEQSTRSRLETEIVQLQEEVSHLRYIESILPSTCDANL